MRQPKPQSAPAAKKGVFREIRDWTLTLSIAIAGSLLIQNYAIAQTEVQNVSMQGTLYEGQRLVEDKLSYRFNAPDRGDIVIINGPEYERRLVKRLIGLPGDVIDIQAGRLYINGELQEEPYVKGSTYAGSVSLPYTVPEGHVFVMGDNREHSIDSRELGPIALSSLEGRAIFRLWPLGVFGQLD
ncbi:signal peptidase I [Paenibacillus xanthanilyticus]|uniref:Signal peptidase I n=1 Tax=Paenibacillus xanthanilyticus TaxID=1783531 RepID=A0ABV8JWX7_9BACL